MDEIATTVPTAMIINMASALGRIFYLYLLLKNIKIGREFQNFKYSVKVGILHLLIKIILPSYIDFISSTYPSRCQPKILIQQCPSLTSFHFCFIFFLPFNLACDFTMFCLPRGLVAGFHYLLPPPPNIICQLDFVAFLCYVLAGGGQSVK